MALDEKKFYMVIQDLLSGKSAIEIAAYRHIERKTITGYLKKLQNPESKYYNLEQYESILFIREVKSGTFVDKDLLNEIIGYVKQGLTNDQIAEACCISKRTVQLYLGNLKDPKSPFYDIKLYNYLKQLREKYSYLARKVGATLGKRSSSYDENFIRQCCQYIINLGETLEEASFHYQIPKSTLYDNLKKITEEELQIELERTFNDHIHHR